MAWPWPGHGLAMAWPWPGHGLASAWPWLGHSLPAACPWLGHGLVAHAQELANLNAERQASVLVTEEISQVKSGCKVALGKRRAPAPPISMLRQGLIFRVTARLSETRKYRKFDVQLVANIDIGGARGRQTLRSSGCCAPPFSSWHCWDLTCDISSVNSLDRA